MGLLIRRFLTDTSAASAIEYALIAGMIACAIVAGLQNVSANLKAKLGKITNALS